MESLLYDENFERFYQDLNDNSTIIPDEVTDYYLKTAGFQCPDKKVFEQIDFFNFNIW